MKGMVRGWNCFPGSQTLLPALWFWGGQGAPSPGPNLLQTFQEHQRRMSSPSIIEVTPNYIHYSTIYKGFSHSLPVANESHRFLQQLPSSPPNHPERRVLLCCAMVWMGGWGHKAVKRLAQVHPARRWPHWHSSPGPFKPLGQGAKHQAAVLLGDHSRLER